MRTRVGDVDVAGDGVEGGARGRMERGKERRAAGSAGGTRADPRARSAAGGDRNQFVCARVDCKDRPRDTRVERERGGGDDAPRRDAP